MINNNGNLIKYLIDLATDISLTPDRLTAKYTHDLSESDLSALNSQNSLELRNYLISGISKDSRVPDFDHVVADFDHVKVADFDHVTNFNGQIVLQ